MLKTQIVSLKWPERAPRFVTVLRQKPLGFQIVAADPLCGAALETYHFNQIIEVEIGYRSHCITSQDATGAHPEQAINLACLQKRGGNLGATFDQQPRQTTSSQRRQDGARAVVGQGHDLDPGLTIRIKFL